MKKNLSKILGFGAIATLTFFQSCSTDDSPILGGGGSSEDAPTITLQSGAGFTTSDVTVSPADTVFFKVSAAKGEEDLRQLVISEDGSTLTKDRIIFNGADAPANPRLIVADAEKAALSIDVGVIVPDQRGETYAYKIEVRDEADESASRTINVTTEAALDTLNLTTTTSTNAVIDSDEFDFIINSRATAGLKQLGVYLDGRLISADSLFSRNANNAAFDANPKSLTGTDLSDTVRVKLGRGDFTVRFDVIDQRDSLRSLSFDIDTRIQSNLVEFTGIRVFNNAGPSAGGIDLDATDSIKNVSSTITADVDIADIGFGAGSDWLRQWSPAAGVTMKKLPTSSELTYANAATEESLSSAYAGIAAEITSTGTTEALLVNDVYIARKGDRYYIIEVASINETTGDNNDFIEFNAKRRVN